MNSGWRCHEEPPLSPFSSSSTDETAATSFHASSYKDRLYEAIGPRSPALSCDDDRHRRPSRMTRPRASSNSSSLTAETGRTAKSAPAGGRTTSRFFAFLRRGSSRNHSMIEEMPPSPALTTTAKSYRPRSPPPQSLDPLDPLPAVRPESILSQSTYHTASSSHIYALAGRPSSPTRSELSLSHFRILPPATRPPTSLSTTSMPRSVASLAPSMQSRWTSDDMPPSLPPIPTSTEQTSTLYGRLSRASSNATSSSGGSAGRRRRRGEALATLEGKAGRASSAQSSFPRSRPATLSTVLEPRPHSRDFLDLGGSDDESVVNEADEPYSMASSIRSAPRSCARSPTIGMTAISPPVKPSHYLSHSSAPLFGAPISLPVPRKRNLRPVPRPPASSPRFTTPRHSVLMRPPPAMPEICVRRTAGPSFLSFDDDEEG